MNQLIGLTNSYLDMFVLQLHNASLDDLENYIFVHTKKKKSYLHVFLLYINVIISYSFKEINQLIDQDEFVFKLCAA